MKKFFSCFCAAVAALSTVAFAHCAKPKPQTGDGAVLTGQNLGSLVGKTVGVAQLFNVPGLTLQVVLNKYGVEYQIIESLQTEKATDKVNLLAVDAADISPAYGCDYYLCPEPAATAKMNGTKEKPVSLVWAGSLQELYGETYYNGNKGYPQAVLVAKKEIAGDTVTGNVVSAMGNAFQYLSNAQPQTILSLLDRVRTNGLTPAFNQNNLTASVVENCSVGFSSAADCKERVNTFLSELQAVNPSAAATVSDEFYYTGAFTDTATEGTRTIYAPDGAPALALAELIERNLSGLQCEVIDASTVRTKVTGASPAADYCILPVDLASKLLGTGNVYRMLGTVTNGNLYFLTVKNA